MKTLLRAGALLSTGLFATTASAQITTFSIDYHSVTNTLPDSGGGFPIRHGDILTPAFATPMLGPLPPPMIMLPHGLGGLGLIPACTGMPAGSPCPVEVDAFSFGTDDLMPPNPIPAGALQWSVDVFAVGAGPLPPSIPSESPVGDSGTDVFLSVVMMPPPPLPPGAPFPHRGLFDGDGLPSGSGFTYPGFGLIEPSFPFAGPLGNGDNLDAFDVQSVGGMPGPVAYFSLDEAFPDPLAIAPGTGTAPTNGFAGADVLQSVIGGPGPFLFAPGFALGLNLAGGPDDLDALILAENGDGVFQPSQTPFDWMGGGTDMLLFSVRRGSAVIGAPDSLAGIPIEEGDILTTPLSPILGGVSPFPAILIAAENLGLATLRSGTAPGNFADDLDALDHRLGIFVDCDMDGVDDTIAIAMGFVVDGNMNGIPDVCEFCTPLPNSTGVPTVLTLTVPGSPGTGVHLEGTSGPPGEFGYFLIGDGLMAPGLPVGSGLLCLDTMGNISRYNVPGVMNSIGSFNGAGILVNLVGTSTVGTGFDIPNPIPIPIGGMITTGTTYHFQLWHRDTPTTSNFSNTVTYTF